VNAYRRWGRHERLDSSLYATFAEAKVDDVVVVSARWAAGAGFSATVQVILLSTEEVVGRWDAGDIADAGRFAEVLWLEVRRSWTDPGAHPPFDPVRAADRLAETGACDAAVALYRRSLPDEAALTMHEVKRVEESRRRFDRCQREIRTRDASIAEEAAKFRFDVDAGAISQRVQDALRKALEKSRLEKMVAGMTNKPVSLALRPTECVLSIRYNPAWYQEAIATLPTHAAGGGRALHLEPWANLMHEILDLVGRTGEQLAPHEQDMLQKLRFALNLTRFGGDYVEIEFASRDENLLIADTLRVGVAERPEVLVPTIAPRALREQIFVLDAPQLITGQMTEAGLVYRFFELEP
jgi:hypothetical protein